MNIHSTLVKTDKWANLEHPNIVIWYSINHLIYYENERTRVLKITMWVSESHSVVSDSLWPHGLYSLWNSLGQDTGVDSLSLLQGIFPTQVSHIAGNSLPAEP